MPKVIGTIDYYNIVEEDKQYFIIDRETDEKISADQFVFYRSRSTGRIVSRKKLEEVIAQMPSAHLQQFFHPLPNYRVETLVQAKVLIPIQFDYTDWIKEVWV